MDIPFRHFADQWFPECIAACLLISQRNELKISRFRVYVLQMAAAIEGLRFAEVGVKPGHPQGLGFVENSWLKNWVQR